MQHRSSEWPSQHWYLIWYRTNHSLFRCSCRTSVLPLAEPIYLQHRRRESSVYRLGSDWRHGPRLCGREQFSSFLKDMIDHDWFLSTVIIRNSYDHYKLRVSSSERAFSPVLWRRNSLSILQALEAILGMWRLCWTALPFERWSYTALQLFLRIALQSCFLREKFREYRIILKDSVNMNRHTCSVVLPTLNKCKYAQMFMHFAAEKVIG